MDFTLDEVGKFISQVGIPFVIAGGLGYCLWKIGHAAGNLLLDQWKKKEKRLDALEKRVEEVNNGQRTAVERRLDLANEYLKDSSDTQKAQTEALSRVSDSLTQMGEAFRFFAENRPCIHDSDIPRIELDEDLEGIGGNDLNSKAKERVLRRRRRTDEKEGEEES